jgi:DNA-binding transcriptional MerR regulator
MNERRLKVDEAAAVTRIEVSLLWRFAEEGLIAPSTEGYSEADLAELRRIRRLHDELELDYPAIEVVLRLTRRVRELHDELERLREELRRDPGIDP